ncbi:MAG: hypothetical protein M3N32_08970 [Actinomycetota bacterium]|nr:hypothetical protein [Actinomycetota bacterium]
MTRIRDHLPAHIRRPLGSARRRVLLRLGAYQLRSRGPSASAIQRLALGWGNRGFSAGEAYVFEALNYAAGSKGPILECGSGLTTLALGLTAAVTAPVWTLEHDPAWADRIRRRLEMLGATGPAVLDAPLRPYGDIEWYEVPSELPDEFDLVLCDGPPGKTRGGRWGLWEVLGDRLHAATVILDDAQRPGEAAIIRRLREEGWEAEIRPDDRRSFAILTRSSQSAG